MERENDFFFSEFVAPDDVREDEMLALDILPGIHSEDIPTASSVNNAMKEQLDRMTVQDRLLLKYAAILGFDFNLNDLQVVCCEMEIDQIIMSLNHLMANQILFLNCTFGHTADNSSRHLSKQSIECYRSCFCQLCLNNSIFRNYRKPFLLHGDSFQLRFLSTAFRSNIMSCMTKDQLISMHFDIARDLESKGTMCSYCRSESKREHTDSSSSSKAIGHCTCSQIQVRAKIFGTIAAIYLNSKVMFLPAYFYRKAAEVSVDSNYPIEALMYIEESLRLLPDLENSTAIESFHKTSQRVSVETLISSNMILTSMSHLLLGNYPEAMCFLEKAFKTLDVDPTYLCGSYSQMKIFFDNVEIHNIYERLPHVHSYLKLTKIICLWCEILVGAEEYELAHEALKIAYGALSICPTDFYEIMSFQLLLYTTISCGKPKKKLKTLENNTLNISCSHLENDISTIQESEASIISKTYIKFVQTNVSRNRLDRAIGLAIDGIKTLKSLKMDEGVAMVCILLLQVYIRQNRFQDSLEILVELGGQLKTGNTLIHAHYFCALSSVIIEMLKESNDADFASNQENIRKCNEFAMNWSMNLAQCLAKDMAFYVSVKLSLWCCCLCYQPPWHYPTPPVNLFWGFENSLFGCMKRDELHKWPDYEKAFLRCYNIAIALYEDELKSTYWSIAGSITFYMLKLTGFGSVNAAEARVFVLSELKKIKEKISQHFPIFKKEYSQLKKDVESAKF